MNERTQNLIAECRRQEESCHYMSTMLFEWLKSLRRWRIGFVVGPIVLGGVANWSLLTNLPELKWLVGGCALLAGLAPAVYKALDLDVSLEALASSAHNFKILQDRFRQAWSVAALGPFEEFQTAFDDLMDRMDVARADSITAPERFFKRAQRKIASGDYSFSVDQQNTPRQ